jgi:ABC-type amino acid transport system permease subunit
MVAVAYTDVFRGVPLILILYIIGFGVPGLGIAYFSYLSDVTYGIIALVLVYSPTSPRSTGPASSPSTRARTPPPGL